MNGYDYQQIHDQKLAEQIHVAAIVQVISFDSGKMTVNVQPLSKHLQNGKYESQPPILGIPVAHTYCGGFIFRPWFKKGDIGVVLYMDHDMDNIVISSKEAIPSTVRNHSITDAVFVGAIVSGNCVVPELPDESLALTTENGQAYIAITKEKILVKGNIEVEGSVKADKGFIGKKATYE